MKSKILLTLCALSLGLAAQAQISTALGGSCWVSDSAIVRIAWNSNLNCDSEPDMSSYTELGFHCGYNSFAGQVDFDDPLAKTGINDGMDTFRVELQLDDYFGYPSSVMTSIKFIFNLGADAIDPWAESGRDTIPGGFGCQDLLITFADLQECPTVTPPDTGGTGLTAAELVSYMHILPNPAAERFVVSFDNKQLTQMDFMLSDLTGRIVAQQRNIRADRVEVQRGNLAAGMYMAILRGQDGRMSTRRVLLK